MDLKLDEQIQKHFDTRTPNKNGAWIDYCRKPIPDKDTIYVGQNDYLNVAKDSYVVEKQISSLRDSKSEVVMANVFVVDEVFPEVEAKFAKMVGTEACLLTQSGYSANSGLIASICDKKTNVYADASIHASLWDGIANKRPITHLFEHNNVVHLEKLIKEHGPGVILVEGLYSVEGDTCPLEKVLDLRDKYNCIVVLDESHSLGLYGENGRGMCYEFTKSGREIDFITASLGKTFCTRAGIVAGKAKRISYIREVSRHYIFSTSVLIHEVARISAFIDVIISADEKRKQLAKNSEIFYEGVIKLGYNILASKPSPILSISLNSEEEMVRFGKFLVSKNIHTSSFMYPATPRNAPVIRFSLHSNLNEHKVHVILSALEQYKTLQTQVEAGQNLLISKKLVSISV